MNQNLTLWMGRRKPEGGSGCVLHVSERHQATDGPDLLTVWCTGRDRCPAALTGSVTLLQKMASRKRAVTGGAR